MKTLGEVMNALKNCGRHQKCCVGCPYESMSYPAKIGNTCKDMMHYDAICYLSEYQKIEDEYEELKDWWAEEHAENVPLTWDELKGMEGKPVWLEVKYQNPDAIYKYWTIVKYFDSHEGEDLVFTGTGFYHRSLLGTGWQVYRKEREQ